MKEILVNRIHNLAKKLQEKNIDVALIMEATDLYYYSDTIVSGTLAISKEAKSVYLIKKGIDIAKHESHIDDIINSDSIKDYKHILIIKNIQFSKIGIEKDVLPVSLYEKMRSVFINSEFVDISFDIRWQRAMKSPYEIALLKQSAKMLDCTMQDAKELIKPNLREIDISAALEYRSRKRLNQGKNRMRSFNGDVFMGTLTSSKQSSSKTTSLKATTGIGLSKSFREGASEKRIKEKQPIIVDFLFNNQGYIADETRTFAIGDLNGKFKDAFKVCLDIMYFLEENAKDGVIAFELYNKCVNIAEKAGYKNSFMGINDDQVPFIGHGVGLELDEFPFIAKNQYYPLMEGMTFAFEPKMVFENEGAIGIENTYLVLQNSIEPLTQHPKEIIYI